MVSVGGLEGRRHVPHDRNRFLQGWRTRLQPLSERISLYVGHRVIRQPRSCLTCRENRHDVRVLEGRCQMDLPLESLGRYAGAHLSWQHLDNDPPVQA